MAAKSEISIFLKENGLTSIDMDKFWSDLITTNKIVENLSKHNKTWRDLPIHLIKKLPDQKERDLRAREKAQEEKTAKELEEARIKDEKKYYSDHFEKIMVSKIDNGESLTEKELESLVCDFGIEREYGEDGRWTRGVSTVCNLCDRFFIVYWEQGLTEYQENEFYNQPREVVKKEYDKVVHVVKWEEIKKD